MEDKREYDVEGGAPAYPMRNERFASIAQANGIHKGEAVENFGDIETAEEYGYVSRG